MEIRQLPANEYDKALDLSLDVFSSNAEERISMKRGWKLSRISFIISN